MFKNIIAYRYKNRERGAFLSGVFLGTLLRSNTIEKPQCFNFNGNGEYYVSYVVFNSKTEIDLPYALDNNGLNDCLTCLALTEEEKAKCHRGKASLNTILECYDLYHLVYDTSSNVVKALTIREQPKEFSERLILGNTQGFTISTLEGIINNLGSDSIEDQMYDKLNRRDDEETDSELYNKLNEDSIKIRNVIHCLHLDLYDDAVSSEVLRVLGKYILQ